MEQPTTKNKKNKNNKDNNNTTKNKREKYQTKACGACQKKHQKCSGTHPCAYCTFANLECTYSVQSKRGPKRKKNDEEDQLVKSSSSSSSSSATNEHSLVVSGIYKFILILPLCSSFNTHAQRI